MTDSRITSAVADSLIARQLKEWPLASANYRALENVEVKEFNIGGMPVKVQFNPARAVSSGAKVDAASLAARPCFLCAANRPAEQEYIYIDGRYELLVNPFPIFPRHLTIPANTHTEQLISGRIADMMRMALELDTYTIFYNGPRCGASAPDHMHFQGGNSDFLTLASAIEASDLSFLQSDSGASLSLSTSLPVRCFIIDAHSPEAGAAMFERLYSAMPLAEGEKEPMMNILCQTKGKGQTRIIVVPRRRHRPSCYGTEGESCIMLSPASVDMGGVFITPRRTDFDKITPDILLGILDEVCLDRNSIETIAKNIK